MRDRKSAGWWWKPRQTTQRLHKKGEGKSFAPRECEEEVEGDQLIKKIHGKKINHPKTCSKHGCAWPVLFKRGKLVGESIVILWLCLQAVLFMGFPQRLEEWSMVVLRSCFQAVLFTVFQKQYRNWKARHLKEYVGHVLLGSMAVLSSYFLECIKGFKIKDFHSLSMGVLCPCSAPRSASAFSSTRPLMVQGTMNPQDLFISLEACLWLLPNTIH